jgi:hypothetical protein
MSTESLVPDEDIRITCAETDGGLWTASAWSSELMVANRTARTEDEARQRLVAFLQGQRKTPSVSSDASESLTSSNVAPSQLHVLPAEKPFGVTMHPRLEVTDVDGEYILPEGTSISGTLTLQKDLKVVICHEADGFIATAPELDVDCVGRGENEDQAFRALLSVIGANYAAFVAQMPSASDFAELSLNLVAWFVREEPKA